MKTFYDQHILRKSFKVGQKVLLYDSHLHLFTGKLRSKWSGLYLVKQVFPHGAIEVQNFTNWAIKLPFEEVKKLLNESLPKYTMDGELFPVPAKEQLSFCSDNSGVNEFFDDLIEIARTAKKIFLIVLVVNFGLRWCSGGRLRVTRGRSTSSKQRLRGKWPSGGCAHPSRRRTWTGAAIDLHWLV